MKIRVISDLHVDVSNYSFTRYDEDVLVIPGDIANGLSGIAWVREQIPDDLKTFIILGNHDFYYNEYYSVIKNWKNFIESRPNITLLTNSSEIYEDVLFVGGTMWCDFNLFGIVEKTFVIQASKRGIVDFSYISYEDYGIVKPWSPSNCMDEFQDFTNYLKVLYNNHYDITLVKEKTKRRKEKIVVISHFLPSAKSIPDRFKGNMINAYFASDVESLVERADLWIHGHTHDNCDYMIGDCRVVCNPRGYGKENIANFKDDFIVEI